MELHPTAGVVGDAPSACREYVDRLPLSLEAKRRILAQIGPDADRARAMAALHRVLAGAPAPGNPAVSSIPLRLRLACPSSAAGGLAATAAPDGRGHLRLATTPRLRRTPMAPSGWLAPLSTRAWRAIRRSVRGRAADRRGRDPRPPGSAPDPRPRWTAGLRRFLLFGLVLGQTAVAAHFMTEVLPYHGRRPLEIAILVLFALLFGWVSLGFWTGVVGFAVLLAGKDRHSITRTLRRVGEIPPDARTAVIMPICNEDVPRVFAGLRAAYTSLARTGALDRFDFFVLSDSSDPDARIAETRAWVDLCCAVGGFGRIFHRWRRHRIKRKSGNVADFCRRWGSEYRYMVVLDADSVMSGGCLVDLVRLMEANPRTGIIQTAPRAAGRETLYARIQQFATRVYGPLFTAGLNFWQLGESYYWGHNAIIRVDPFMRHCALGRLPGRGASSREILSHDFVEAALMRRAGWAVWIAYDLPGSYEEVPPNLVDELKRDGRWCRGNLINSRLFLAEGLHPAHRAVFMAGVMSYVSAPLWLASLALSTAFVVLQTVVGPRYFVEPRQLFPVWPEWHPQWAAALAAATALVLFLPKILSVALVLARGSRDFGGPARLVVDLVAETAFSAVLAPIRMVFHTRFVLAALTGWETPWSSPPRQDAETSWGEALRRHGGQTLVGIAWAAGVRAIAPAFFWWMLPVAGALAVSIPFSVWSSRVSLGRRLRRARLFLVPEESRPPLELRLVRRFLDRTATARFADAILDPVVNAVACAAAAPSRELVDATRRARVQLVTAGLRQGPAALTRRDRMVLLSDPVALSWLHFEVWSSAAALARWRGGEGRASFDRRPRVLEAP